MVKFCELPFTRAGKQWARKALRGSGKTYGKVGATESSPYCWQASRLFTGKQWEAPAGQWCHCRGSSTHHRWQATGARRTRRNEEGTCLPLLYFAISLLHSTNKTQHSARWQERDVFTKSRLGQKVKESESRSVMFDFLRIIHGILQGRVLEWVAICFSRGSSQPRDQTQVSHIADGFFAIWASREAQIRATQVDLELRGYKPITSSHLLWLLTSTCILLGIFELCQHKVYSVFHRSTEFLTSPCSEEIHSFNSHLYPPLVMLLTLQIYSQFPWAFSYLKAKLKHLLSTIYM